MSTLDSSQGADEAFDYIAGHADAGPHFAKQLLLSFALAVAIVSP
jgi:hypothetical protein